jgi:hypothetical protein
MIYLRQAPAWLPAGPAADAAEAVTEQLVALLAKPARTHHRARRLEEAHRSVATKPRCETRLLAFGLRSGLA